MKVKSLSYIHSFNVGQFLNDKVGIEIELSETDNDDEAFELARQKVHQWAKEIQDAVMNPSTPDYSFPQFSEAMAARTTPIPKQQPIEQRIGVFAEDILSCKDLKTLSTYKLLVKSKPELQEAYDKRKKELEK